MSAKLKIATKEDAERVEKLVGQCHAETGIRMDETARAEALAPLLEGSPHGVVYLIGPPTSPIGYLALSFGYSIALGGLEGFLDEIFVRPSVRRRGMASEAIGALAAALPAHGVRALHMRVGDVATGLHQRLRFSASPRPRFVTRAL